jgi:hypothetical protein
MPSISKSALTTIGGVVVAYAIGVVVERGLKAAFNR